MNLQEQISRIKGIMGLKESNENPMNPEFFKIYNTENNEDFSDSVVKEIVWRVGTINHIPTRFGYGGIWFADSKQAAENFATLRRWEDTTAHPYHINLKNPKYYSDFWNDYTDDMLSVRGHDYLLMQKLIFNGKHDGIVIGEDFWYDSDDPNLVVKGKQFVVFNPKNIKPA